MIFVLANNNNPGLESAAYNKSFYGNLHKWLINKCLEQVLYMFVLLALIEKHPNSHHCLIHCYYVGSLKQTMF